MAQVLTVEQALPKLEWMSLDELRAVEVMPRVTPQRGYALQLPEGYGIDGGASRMDVLAGGLTGGPSTPVYVLKKESDAFATLRRAKQRKRPGREKSWKASEKQVQTLAEELHERAETEAEEDREHGGRWSTETVLNRDRESMEGDRLDVTDRNWVDDIIREDMGEEESDFTQDDIIEALWIARAKERGTTPAPNPDVQHYSFHGYPVSVERSDGGGWYVKIHNLDGELVLDTHVSEKPIRKQLETFFGRMFPRALPASLEAKEWAEEFAREHPEQYEKLRAAITKRRVKKPIETGFATRPVESGTGPRLTPEQSAKWERAADKMRPQPNPTTASPTDLMRRLKF